LAKGNNNLFVSTNLNNTLQHVKHEGQKSKPNVMLVMIESLSTLYMGIYGDDKNLILNGKIAILGVGVV